MSCSMLKKMVGIALLGAVLVSYGTASAANLKEPLTVDSWRDLRTDYVTTWYIYNDNVTDGILDPGDTMIDTFQNWWTAISSHSQHNYSDGSINPYGGYFTYDDETDDIPSAPINGAWTTDHSSPNFWLPMEKNQLTFYMSYSQFDNNDFTSFYDSDPNLTPNQKEMLKERNINKNGYCLGWVSNKVVKDENGQYQHSSGVTTDVAMDIYVHDGAGTYQVEFGQDGVQDSVSNPSISCSNDISSLAKEYETFQPPVFNEATGTYDYASNIAYATEKGLTEAQFNALVASMNQYEVDPNNVAGAIYADKTPSEIAANLVEDDGVTPYLYQDAFQDRSSYDSTSTDGGVIAGLSGYTDYDPELNNWAQQQVIRIDLSDATLEGIETVVFYDFGDSIVGASGTQQTNPRAIRFYVVDGMLVWKDPNDLENEDLWIWFPENRIYIARVNIVPEPTTLAILGFGGVTVLLRRVRRKR